MSVNSYNLLVVILQLSVISYQLLLTSVSVGDIRLLLRLIAHIICMLIKDTITQGKGVIF